MLIVISPAKTLDYETAVTIKKHTQPQFMKRSAVLVHQLRDYTPKALAKLMSVSDKLAELNANRYTDWQPKATTKNARQSLAAFQGDVYVGMNASTFSKEDFAFAQNHLAILSGLYGVLRPLDLMQPYRLEMGTKLENDCGKDLYDFWGNDITMALNKQLKKNQGEVLINLASVEYFRSVRSEHLNAQIIAPVFKDFKNDKYKIISFFAKKARGTMAGWIIRNQITDPKRLTKFTEDGYQYSPEESTSDKPVFLRR